MPGLLYYLPNRRSATRADLADAGLGYAFHVEMPITVTGVAAGPDEQPGCVVGSISAHLVKMVADRQQWRPIPGSDAWVGRYTDESVPAAALARQRMLDGHLVELGDGQQYVIPVARGINGDGDDMGWYCRLPESVGLDETGNWTAGEVVDAYRQLWDVGQAYWDAKAGMVEDGPAQYTFDFAGINDAALLALATNYRVGKAEVALLGLFTDRVTRDILDAVIDWPVVAAWIKKKALESVPEGSSTADLPAASSTDIVPPSPTSGP